MIRFGPAGIGGNADAVTNLNTYAELGFTAAEVALTHSIYLRSESTLPIRREAERLGIRLSVHAPYYVNLNGTRDIQEKSRHHILAAAAIGEALGATHVVFHPGAYSNDRELCYRRIRDQVQRMVIFAETQKWKIKLAPETMGKVNIFGSVEEVGWLVRDTGCSACLDFAHMKARRNEVPIDILIKLFPGDWHCHFSGIIFNESGEKGHRTTAPEEWTELLARLPRDRNITIINESPTMIEDSVEGIRLNHQILESCPTIRTPSPSPLSKPSLSAFPASPSEIPRDLSMVKPPSSSDSTETVAPASKISS
jgi:deoxyribonuclease-4